MDTEPFADEDANAKQRLPIKTYHCRFCSHLLLASTRELLSSTTPLPRRRMASMIEGGADIGEGAAGGLDGALILELPPSSRKSDRNLRGDSRREASYEENQSEERDTITQTDTKTATSGGEAVVPPTTTDERKRTEQAHYTIPLSTLLPDPTPVIIRREDGFEKRLLLRCGRCRVVVGYRLFNTAGGSTTDQDLDVDEEDEEEGEDGDAIRFRPGKQDGAIYLLPGSIVGTEDLDVGTDTEGGGPNAMIERNAVLRGMEAEWMAWIK